MGYELKVAVNLPQYLVSERCKQAVRHVQ